jgi:hypothetical protein
MICGSWRSAEALDDAETDLELLRRLLRRYAARGFGSETLRAFIRRGVEFAMELAWCYYQDSVTAQRAPDVVYWKAVDFFWSLLNWHGAPCRVLAEAATYIAEAAAKYSWPARWPFLAMAAVAAMKKRCKLPEAAAEALGPEEYRTIKAFLEQVEGVVEAAGRRFAVVKKKRHITIVEYEHGGRNSKKSKRLAKPHFPH